MTIDIKELDPGIRETVRRLNEAGFETSDSGDGVTKIAAGWPADEVLAVPHVFIPCEPSVLVMAARTLQHVLSQWGVSLDPVGRGDVSIQATYDPADESASLALYGLNDAALAAIDEDSKRSW